MTQADVILIGDVVTMSPGQPRAEAVAVKDGAIVAVGTACEVSALESPATRVIDCRRWTVVPGFIDAHCHILASAAARLSVDCSPRAVRSIADIQARIRNRKNELPDGAWIRAVGYNEFYLREKRHPNCHDLNQAVPTSPVRLIHRSGHACVLNSLAMSLIGIDASTEDPPGGIIERDLTGEPTGLLLGAMDYWDRYLPRLGEGDVVQGVSIFGNELLAGGVTSVVDATATNSYDEWRVLDGFCRSGYLKSRVSMMVGPESMGDFCECGAAFGTMGMVRLAGVKIVVDETTGEVFPASDDLEGALMSAHMAGFQTVLHAVEGRPLEAAVNALTMILSKAPKVDHRHRIEHCSLCPPEIRRHLKELGLVVVSQPAFIYQNGERYLQTVASREIPCLYPFGALVGDGVVVAAGSDSPTGAVNPLIGICAAVTRKTENGEVVGAEQKLEPEMALALYTRDAAYATFGEGSFGTLTPGKRADMVVLSDDPLSCPHDALGNIRIEITLVDGRVVYEGG
ncbi:MAG: amidohydrolase [Chloroflexota bacterium]